MDIPDADRWSLPSTMVSASMKIRVRCEYAVSVPANTVHQKPHIAERTTDKRDYICRKKDHTGGL